MSKGRGRNPNGAGTVYKEAVPGRSPRWVSEAFTTLPDGRRVRVRGRGPTPEAATAERLRRVLALERANPSADRMTVRALADRWKDARRHEWRAATLYSYEVALERHILPEIGGALVQRVGPLDAQRVLARVMRLSKDKHVSAANRARRVMHAMFAFAVSMQLVPFNPVDGVRPIRQVERERGWWTRGQVIAFLVAAARSPYRLMFEVAIESGLRQGELLALRWRDVTGDGLSVRRTYSRHAPGKVQEAPKSSAGRRTVPLPRRVLLLLEERRRAPDDLVFPSRKGALLNPSNVNRALRSYAARADVPILRFHELRRTYATLQAEAGRSPKEIQVLLGHSTETLALRVYTSVNQEQLRGAVLDVWGSSGGSSANPPQPVVASDGPARVAGVAPDTYN